MTRGLVMLLIICACGSSQRKEVVPDMTDPEWATTYVARAETGCACGDAACLETAHAELAKLVAAHGGLDDAPPSVHAAHGKFDKCWRDGTRDIARDLDHVATSICTCGTAECLRLAKIELSTLLDGKYREDFEAQLAASPPAKASAERATACITKLTMPADLAMTAIESATEGMCRCKDVACAQAVMKQREAAMTKYLDLDPRIDHRKVSALGAQWCECLAKAAKEELKNLSPAPALTAIDVSVSCR